MAVEVCADSRQIFEAVIAVASGKKSKSELSGVGEEEFAPWIIGPVMSGRPLRQKIGELVDRQPCPANQGSQGSAVEFIVQGNGQNRDGAGLDQSHVAATPPVFDPAGPGKSTDRLGTGTNRCTTRLIRDRSSRLFALSHSASPLRKPQKLWE